MNKLSIYENLNIQKKIIDNNLDNLILKDNINKNLEALIKDIKFIKKITVKSFILYAKKMKYIIESKRYKERYNTLDEFLKKELNTSYRTVKEQIDIYEYFFMDNIELTTDLDKFEYSKVKDALPLLRSENIKKEDKLKIRDLLLKISKNKSKNEINAIINELKDLYNKPKDVKSYFDERMMQLRYLEYSPIQKEADKLLFKKKYEFNNKKSSNKKMTVIQYASILINKFENLPSLELFDFVEDENEKKELLKRINILKTHIKDLKKIIKSLEKFI